jgi:hypothetical protein
VGDKISSPPEVFISILSESWDLLNEYFCSFRYKNRQQLSPTLFAPKKNHLRRKKDGARIIKGRPFLSSLGVLGTNYKRKEHPHD